METGIINDLTPSTCPGCRALDSLPPVQTPSWNALVLVHCVLKAHNPVGLTNGSHVRWTPAQTLDVVTTYPTLILL